MSARPEARQVLSNPGSARVTRVAGLARRQARERHGRFLAEGPQSVREAVRHAPDHVLDVYLTEAAAERYREIVSQARQSGIHTHLVSPSVMEAMSADAQGALAVVGVGALAAPGRGRGAAEGSTTGASTDPAVGSVGDWAHALAGARLVAVLTEVQDPGNAGTIIRAADAAGADAVVLARGSVEATSPKVVRSTAGSLFHLPVLTGGGLEEVVGALRAAGLTLLAADGRGPVDLFEADELLAAPGAWLLGNEARGLAPAALEQADAVVSIPIYGAAESLNVATAATICLYASARAQR
ncbi:MAG: RNA methyltransferase [Actinomyces sp.]|uniref:TrmH family RNA methyltransferase n=1 Tax=Actinomyces sp. TaxID=29317 RepID=UPI0026DAD0A3|nr:RNA methyltransferase [Actinomyces sp.]MDO4243702.1 RNA methyltransferase [Actinomyces sp.]